MKRALIDRAVPLSLLLVPLLLLPAGAQNRNFKATLAGYQEVPAISTAGGGTFQARISDDGAAIHYQLSYDVTLYQAVATLRTPDIEAAVGELNAVYAAQGVRVAVQSGEILVTSRDRHAPSSAPAASGNGPKTEAATP